MVTTTGTHTSTKLSTITFPRLHKRHRHHKLNNYLARNARQQAQRHDSQKTHASSSKVGQDSALDDVEDLEDGTMYAYDQLDYGNGIIRLLRVFPGEENDTIKCSLQNADLGDTPSYIALSYTWDRDDRHEYIVCDGMPLQVGRNLWTFLHQFRKSSGHQAAHLWIDAISIDQRNMRERNHQVAQMRDIYSGADSVIVWLGDATHDAQLAFELVHGPKCLVVQQGEDLRLHRSKRQWGALAKLLSRPYWMRVWIIQEVILAKSVTLWCGDYSAPLSSFERICRWLQHLQKSWSPHNASHNVLDTQGWLLCKHRSQWHSPLRTNISKSQFGLRRLIELYSASNSTDIRDKIYGLLGLVSKSAMSHYPIQADYSKTRVEVLVDVIRNQCEWGSLAKDADNHKFVRLLKDLLRVSHRDLASHILRYATDLKKHMHVLATAEYISLPMCRVGTVIEVGFDINHQGITSKRTFRKGNDNLVNPFIHPQRLSSSAALEATSHLQGMETGMQSVLSVDLPRSFGREQDRMTEETTSACENDAEYGPFSRAIIPLSLRQSFLQSIEVATEAHAVHRRQTAPVSTTRSVFVGTDDIMGITTSPIRSGDAICVFQDAACDQNALVMRQDGRHGSWITVGAAIQWKQNLHPLEDYEATRGFLTLNQTPELGQPIYGPNWRTADFVRPESQPRKSLKARSRHYRFNFTKPAQLSTAGERLRFYCVPTSLPELLRCIPDLVLGIWEKESRTVKASAPTRPTNHDRRSQSGHAPDVHGPGKRGRYYINGVMLLRNAEEPGRQLPVCARESIQAT